jgi:K+-transporting ATPase KdpF subunit
MCIVAGQYGAGAIADAPQEVIMNNMMWLSLWLAIGLLAYLIYALLRAERF